MCFRPKIHASMDQVPGPIIANVAPSVANINGIHPWAAGAAKAICASTTVTTIPANGVHKPAISRSPASAPIVCIAYAGQAGAELRHAIPQ